MDLFGAAYSGHIEIYCLNSYYAIRLGGQYIHTIYTFPPMRLLCRELWLLYSWKQVASWLVRSTPERAVRVRVLAGDIVLCSGQDILLSQCLSPPRCINVYRQIVGENLTNCGEVTCDGLASRPGDVEILLAASCYRNRDKLRQLWGSWLQGFLFMKTSIWSKMERTVTMTLYIELIKWIEH